MRLKARFKSSAAKQEKRLAIAPRLKYLRRVAFVVANLLERYEYIPGERIEQRLPRIARNQGRDRIALPCDFTP